MDKVIVVGAGCFGTSLAWRLARAGVAVTLVDQFAPGDARASSGGESRLLRCAHGSDARYAVLARRARTLWRELEAETGEELLLEHGVAWFAHGEQGWEVASEAVLADLGIPVQRLAPEAAGALFPSFSGEDLAFVLLEPEAGVLRAAAAVGALSAAARARGVCLERARARPAARAVLLDDGRRLRADVVVWACGAWLAELFPGLVELRSTRQELFFLDGGPLWAGAGVPGWVDYDAAMYGTGDVDGLGVKLAPDSEGPELGPDEPLPPASTEGERAARDYARRRFPALAGAPLHSARTCRYELTADSHFVMAEHPEHPGVWLLGGGSGHGFKHGPALAELLCGVLAGNADPPAHFAVGSRRPARSLRTAGSGR